MSISGEVEDYKLDFVAPKVEIIKGVVSCDNQLGSVKIKDLPTSGWKIVQTGNGTGDVYDQLPQPADAPNTKPVEQIINNLAVGTYTYEIINHKGCSSYRIVEIKGDADCDGIADDVDLDDDNDGILDTDEMCAGTMESEFVLKPALSVAGSADTNPKGKLVYEDKFGNRIVLTSAGKDNNNGTIITDVNTGEIKYEVLGNDPVSVEQSRLNIEAFDKAGSSIEMTSIQLNGLRDMDNTAARDAIGANVEGTWTNLVNDYGSGNGQGLLTVVPVVNGQVVQAQVPASNDPQYPFNFSNLITQGVKSDIIFMNKGVLSNGTLAQDWFAPIFTPKTPVKSFQIIVDDIVIDNNSRNIRGRMEASKIKATVKCMLDTDGDGIPNHLDLDSDNDGCPDATEGGSTTLVANAESEGTLKTLQGTSTITKNLGKTVDANGVPTSANGGQAVGSSIDANVVADECDPCNPKSPDFLDTDGDGIADRCDYDDDNDGILDVDESSCDNTTKLLDTVGEINVNNNQTYGPYTLDNGKIVTYEVTGDSSVRVRDLNGQNEQGPVFKTSGSAPEVSAIDIVFSAPILGARFKITDFDEQEQAIVEAYDHKGALIDLANYTTVGTNIATSGANNNTFTSKQSANQVTGDEITDDPIGSVVFEFGNTLISRLKYTVNFNAGASLRFTQISYCGDKDTDKDGIPDRLDLDSDNDGCPDAIEGGKNDETDLITSANLKDADAQLKVGSTSHPSTSEKKNLGGKGDVDAKGVPTIVNGGQLVGKSTLSQKITNIDAVDIASDQAQYCIVAGSQMVLTVGGVTAPVVEEVTDFSTTPYTTKVATGTDLIEYQWYLAGDGTTPDVKLKDVPNEYQGVKTNQLTVNLKEDLNGKKFKVQIKLKGKECPVEKEIAVPIAPKPNAGADDVVTICSGQEYNLTLHKGGEQGVTYTYHTSETTDETVDVVASGKVTPTVTTEYWVLAKNASGCTDTKKVTVNIYESPVALQVANPEICNGNSYQLTDLVSKISDANGDKTKTATYTYKYYTTNTNGVLSGELIGTDLNVSPTTNTTYYIMPTSADGCEGTPLAVEVIVNPLPTFTDTITDVCIDSNVTVAGSGTPNATTPYTSSDTTVATVDNSGVVTGKKVGKTTITYTNDKGCTVSKEITVKKLPEPIMTVTDATCAKGTGETKFAFSNLPTKWKISYTYDGNPVELTGGTSTKEIKLIKPGAYTFTIEDSQTKCSIEKTHTIAELPCMELRKKSKPIVLPVVAGTTKIFYVFEVINKGNVPLKQTTITDNKIPAPNNTIVVTDEVGVGKSVKVEDDSKYFHVVTQADLDTGTGIVENSAEAVSTTDGGQTPPDTSDSGNTHDKEGGDDNDGDGDKGNDPTRTYLTQKPGIELVKSSKFIDGAVKTDGKPQAGEKILYTFVVENTGNVTLTDVTVNDDMFTFPADYTEVPAESTGTQASLLPGQKVTFTAEYTITQDDINNGKKKNTATTTANPPAGTGLTPPTDRSDSGNVPQDEDSDGDGVAGNDPTFTDLAPDPKLELTKKSSDIPADAKVGDVITYTFTLENTGNVTIQKVKITDDKLNITDEPLENFSLKIEAGRGYSATKGIDPGAKVSFTKPYTLTQEDFNNGKVENTATAKGKDPKNGEVSDISDSKNPSDDPDNTDPTKQDDKTVSPLTKTPKVELIKTSALKDPTKTPIEAGDILVYTFTLENTGNVTVKNVHITDKKLGIEQKLLETFPTLMTVKSVGTDGVAYTATDGFDSTEKVSFTVEYALTQDDINNGKAVNTATANGEDKDGNAIPEETSDSGNPNDNDKGGNSTTDKGDDGDTTNDPTTNLIPATPKLELKKSTMPLPAKIEVGTQITYKFVLKNTGNVTIKDIKVSDEKLFGTKDDKALTEFDNVTETTTGKYDATAFSLKPSGVIEFYKKYTLTKEDIDAGEAKNTAEAVGKDPSRTDVRDTSDSDNPNDKGANDNHDGDDKDNNGDGTDDDPTRTQFPDLRNPQIELVKTSVYSDENGDGVYNVGDKITYTFVVKNTGNTTVTGIKVTDAKLGLTGTQALGLTPTELRAKRLDETDYVEGETKGTATYTYVLTQDDIDAGKVENTAVANGKGPKGTTDPSDDSDSGNPTDDKGTDKDPTITEMTPAPKIALKKGSTFNDENGDGLAQVGETITYTFVVTNTGNVSLTKVSVADTGLPVTVTIVPDASNPAKLAPTKTATFTAEYVLKQSDINNGLVRNVATAQGTPPNETTPITTTSDSSNKNDTDDKFGADDDKKADKDTDPNNDPTFTTLPRKRGVKLEKSSKFVEANNMVGQQAGDQIEYTFTITNTGNVTLTNLNVEDKMLADAGVVITNPVVAKLEPGVGHSFKAVYTLTLEDISNGKVENTATVEADAKGFDQPIKDISDSGNSNDKAGNDDPTVTELIPAEPELELLKWSEFPADFELKEGAVITYKFKVTNKGNLKVENLVITDNKIKGVITLDKTTLLPSESTEATATYTLTQDDVDAGQVINTAEVAGTDSQGRTVKDTSDSNNENDKDKTGKDDPTTTQFPTKRVAKIELTKSSGEYIDTNGNGMANVGDQIKYTFTVSNTGNVTVKDIKVTDEKLGLVGASALDLNPKTLKPTEQGTVTYIYTLKQADLDAGKMVNTATANGTAPTGVTNPSDVSDSGNAGDNDGNTDHDGLGTDGANLGKDGKPLGKDGDTTNDPTFTMLAPKPELKLVKTTKANNGKKCDSKVNDVITYTFKVTNTGNVTINNVAITDPMPGLSAITPKDGNFNGTLAPNEVVEFTALYSVTQKDVDAGKITNTATVNGTPVKGELEPAKDKDELCVCAQNKKISLEKTVEKSGDACMIVAGDIMTYKFTVKNEGDVTLHDVSIDDKMLKDEGIEVTLEGTQKKIKEALAPNETAIFEAKYTVKQSDADAGHISNTAVVNTKEGVTAKDTVDKYSCSNNAEIKLEKKAEGNLVVGEKITYTFTVTNTGIVTVHDVKVKDPLKGLLDKAGKETTKFPTIIHEAKRTLKPTESAEFTATYVVTQEDVNAGKVVNTATATALDTYNRVAIAEDTAVVKGTEKPAIKLNKTAVKNGDVITYTFTIENIGNVSLSDIEIMDNMEGLNDIKSINSLLGKITLVPGEVVTFEATYKLTQEDINAGSVKNTAEVQGKSPKGTWASDVSDDDKPVKGDKDNSPNDPTVIEFTSKAEIELIKTTDKPVVKEGDVVTYTFKVKNTGEVTVYNLKVEDPLVGLSAITPNVISELSPDKETTFTATYVVTKEDVKRGYIVNSATAKANSPKAKGTETYDVDDISDSGNVGDENGSELQKEVGHALGTNDKTDDDPTIVKVSSYDIVAKDDVFGAEGGSVLPNDTLNGKPVTVDNTDVTPNTEGPLSIDENGNVTVAPNTPNGTYKIPYKICETGTNNCTTAVATVVINNRKPVKVYNEFSPNGDGKNDYLHIDNIEGYENNTLEIFNRWGNTVWKAKGYNNKDVKFEGISNKGSRAVIYESDELPVGTYYYMLDLGDGSEVMKGWLYINR